MLVHRYSEMPTRLILPAPRHILFIWLRVLGISEDFFLGDPAEAQGWWIWSSAMGVPTATAFTNLS